MNTLCDIWDKFGSKITNMHGSTGDIIFLGTPHREAWNPAFAESDQERLRPWRLRFGPAHAVSCCVGKARCEWACIDTQDICYNLTMSFQDNMHRPAWPYKFKFKISGCPNDCVAAIARADCSIIGTWRDDIRINQDEDQEVRRCRPRHRPAFVVGLCPTKCASTYEGGELSIDNKNCTRCMHCINVMPKALRPGTDTGATILIGAKAPILEGAQMSAVVIPFIKMDASVEDPDETNTRDFKGVHRKACGTGGMRKARTANAWANCIQRLGYKDIPGSRRVGSDSPDDQGTALQPLYFLQGRRSRRRLGTQP